MGAMEGRLRGSVARASRSAIRSRQARSTGNAWASRAACRRASAPTALRDHEEGLAVFDSLAVLDEDFLDHAGLVRLNFIEQLHRLNNA